MQRTGPLAPGRTTRILAALAGLTAVAGALLFRGFTAEDAYISLRYARNLWTGLGPVFNPGEPVNAMTAPLHVAVLAGLHALTADVMAAGKGLGLASVAAGGAILWRHVRGDPALAVLTVALAVLPGPVLLWSLGGLETPLLFLCVAASVPLIAASVEGDRRAYLGLCVLGGIAFLLRHDAALYFGTAILVLALRRGLSRGVLVAWAAGAALPVLWLVFAWRHYGDPLPVSFYRKTPSAGELGVNARYILSYAIWTGAGLIPALLALAARGRLAAGPARRLALLLGAALVPVLAYSLTMATTHMMFQLRALAPYFPVAAALTAALARAAGTPRSLLHAATLGVIVLSALSYAQIVTRSVNGFAAVGEYRRVPLGQYAGFIDGLRANAADIAADWRETAVPGRGPRVHSFAEGVLPYDLGTVYTYGALVSYRHGERFEDMGRFARSADYLHIITPRHGPPEPQLHGIAGARLISDVVVPFDGREERLQVWRNPQPRPHDLARRVDGRRAP